MATTRRHKGRHRAQPVTVTKVEPRIWATALKLAKGDTSRIQVEGATSVVVRNP